MNSRDALLWAAFALVGGAAFDVASAPAVVCLAVALVALRRIGRFRRRSLVLVAAFFVAGAARAHLARRSAAELYLEAAASLPGPTRCVGSAVVASSTIVRGGSARAEVDWESVECEGATLKPFSSFLSGVPEGLARGDRVEVAANLAPTYLFRNEGTGDGLAMIVHTGAASTGGVEDVRVVQRGSGLRHAIDVARAAVRARITATYHPAAEPLGRALVLGETDLAPDDDAAFRTSGLSHLLAVSGTHIVVAILGLVRIVRALLVRIPALAARTHVDRWIAAVAAPAAFVYSDFAGGGGSALRAAAMMAATLAARALGRRGEPSRAFAAALIVGSIVDPLAIFDVSFSLSVSATLGLFCLSPALDRVLAGSGERDGRFAKARAAVAKAAANTLGPSIACAPVLASLAPRLPVVGILANVVAAPLGELVALPLCLGHCVLSWSPLLERGAARVGGGALLAVLEVARVASSAGSGVAVPPPTAWQVAAIVAAAPVVWLGERKARALAGGALLAATLVLELRARRTAQPAALRVSALDVGQGDSILIDLPNGGAMLVDGGGLVGSPVDTGVRVVAPVLRSRRRARVDVVVLSHPHPDHFTGLLSGLDGVDIGEIWETGEADLRGGPAPLVAFLKTMRARGVPVRHPSDLCDRPRSLGGARVEVLAPCPGVREERGANDNSYVLKITYGARSALLMGDAELDEEADLVSSVPGSLRADLLKVGHHGSRTSSSAAFLAKAAPSEAFISCGVRNRFGHPHRLALSALSRVDVRRTDRGGEWRWSTDGEGVVVESPFEGDALGARYALDPRGEPR